MTIRIGARLWAAMAAAALALGAPSRAPILAAEVGGDDPLVRAARQAIAGALATALEHARSFQPVAWGDPATDLSGSIVVFPPMRRSEGWCRSFRYDVHDSRDALTESGVQCRDPAGVWSAAGAPHQRDKRPAATSPGPGPAPAPAPAVGDPSRAQLQQNLARLAYGNAAPDATAADFDAALIQFEADEGLRQGTDEEARARALARSTATLARSSRPGTCPAPEREQTPPLACGYRR